MSKPKNKSGKSRNRRRKGLRIGGIRIKPLGLVVLILILLIIAACVIWFAGKPTQVGGGGFLSPSATPTFTPTPSPTPSPSPTPVPTPRAATIRSLGEIAIQDNLLTAASADGGYDFAPMFSEVSDVMANADYTIADVEGSLGGTADAQGSGKLITPPSLIQALSDCGVDMLNFANDHALDGGWADLQAAMQNCQSAGMEYVGAASSLLERDAAKVVEINGIRVGFVAYTSTLSIFPENADAKARNAAAGAAGLDKDSIQYAINLTSNSNPTTDIQACRDAGAEVVVAIASWGDMFKRDVTKNQQAIAQALVEAGADVIIGYGPHVIQKAVWMEATSNGNVTRRALCMLSNGNFLSDSREQYTDSGVVFQFTIQEKEDLSGLEIVSPVYIPTYVWRIESQSEGEAEGEEGAVQTDYDYRTLACGEWLETAPEGMNYSQESRLRAVWAEAQSVMGSEVAEISKE